MTEGSTAITERDIDLVALDEALEKLGTIDERKVRIVEARFFAGLTVEETAALMSISASTVKREWEFARIWLLREIGGAPANREGGGEVNRRN